MNEVLHANIFFFIASFGVVMFTILVGIAMFYVVKILQVVSRIVERIEKESETVAEDVAHVRAYFRNGNVLAQLVGLAFGRKFGFFNRKTKKRTDAWYDEEDETRTDD